jgi:hypothetical protein
LRAIRALAHSEELDALPAELQEIAALRLRHPAESLRELASRCDPPLSKAAAQRRLARLVALADR